MSLIKILKQKIIKEALVGLDIKKELNDKKRIKNLKNTFKKFDIDGYVIPKNDEYFTEYSKINRLKIISNFSGSAGVAVILKIKITYLPMVDTLFKVKLSQVKILR